MGELFSLLHWMDKETFCNERDFLARFGDLSAASEATRDELTALLRPHILRRTKDDVLKTLPARHEVVIPVPLTPAQIELYRLILTKNYDLLHATSSNGAAKTSASAAAKAGKASLTNLLMELRKVVQHPYLITGAEGNIVRRALLDAGLRSGGEPEVETAADRASAKQVQAVPATTLSDTDAFKLFVDVSGKLTLLRCLLPRLAARGHRVLVFSGTRSTVMPHQFSLMCIGIASAISSHSCCV
jgi:chromodomain-helicase-DNA-binding protein 4